MRAGCRPNAKRVWHALPSLTKASIIYRATDNLRAVPILLGHRKIENTVRYLGIDLGNSLGLAESTKIGTRRHPFPVNSRTRVPRKLLPFTARSANGSFVQEQSPGKQLTQGIK